MCLLLCLSSCVSEGFTWYRYACLLVDCLNIIATCYKNIACFATSTSHAFWLFFKALLLGVILSCWTSYAHTNYIGHIVSHSSRGEGTTFFFFWISDNQSAIFNWTDQFILILWVLKVESRSSISWISRGCTWASLATITVILTSKLWESIL